MKTCDHCGKDCATRVAVVLPGGRVADVGSACARRFKRARPRNLIRSLDKRSQLLAMLRRAKTEVDPGEFKAILCGAAKWDEVLKPQNYKWFLVRNVPIRLLDPPSREYYEQDPFAEDEEDRRQNLERYDELVRLLIVERRPVWPIVLDKRGAILDGFHRLAVLSDHGKKSVKVLWAVPRPSDLIACATAPNQLGYPLLRETSQTDRADSAVKKEEVTVDDVKTAQTAALKELARIGVKDNIVVRLKRCRGNWIAMYRSRTQFTGAGRGPIFWVSPETWNHLVKEKAEVGETPPNHVDLLNVLTDSILHEYGHVIAEWAQLRSEPMKKIIVAGWPGWDEERFAEDFAQWLRGGFVYGDESKLQSVVKLYIHEAFQ